MRLSFFQRASARVAGLVCCFAMALIAQSASAQVYPNGTTCKFRAIHAVSSIGAQCFETLAQAEAWIRQEPATGGGAYAYLQRDPTKDQIDDSNLLNPHHVLNYRVSPRPGTLAADWFRLFSDGNTWNTCACDASGTPGCYASGGMSTCDTNPDMCKFNKRCAGNTNILPALTSFMSRANCSLSVATTSPRPAQPFVNGSDDLDDDSQPEGYVPPANSGTSFFFWQSQGEVVTVQRSGATCASPQTRSFLFERVAPLICQAGFSPTQNSPISEYCRSAATGKILAWELPSEQCEVGNPCVPTTGAKIQTPRTPIGTAIPGMTLAYNSLSSGYDNQYLGESWTGLLSSQLLLPSSTSPYVKHQDERGNVEVYKSIGTNLWRPMNRPGAGLLVRQMVNGVCASHTLHETGRRLVYGCAGDARLKRIEYPDAPARDLTVIYAAADMYDNSGVQIGFRGTPESMREASGRQADFLYTRINPSANCSAAVSPRACNAIRLRGIVDATNEVTTFDYDAYGRIEYINYPDGTRDRYEYGKLSEICPASLCVGTVPSSLPPTLLTGVHKLKPGPGNTYTSVQTGFYQYDNVGRVLVSTHPGDAGRVQFSYANPSAPVATVWTGDSRSFQLTVNASRQFVFSKIGNTTKTSNGVSFKTTRSYVDGYVRNVVDSRGVRTDTTVVNGLVTKTVEAANDTAGNKRTIEVDWNFAYKVPTERRVFDSSGELKSRSVLRYDAGRLVARCTFDVAVASASNYVCGDLENAPFGVRQIRLGRCTSQGVANKECPFIGAITFVDGARVDAPDVIKLTYRFNDETATCATSETCAFRRGDLHTVERFVPTSGANGVTLRSEYRAFDGAGRPLTVTDANGIVTDFTYNSRGWLTKSVIHGLSDSTTSIEYDDGGHVAKITRPDGSYLSFVYDAYDRLTLVKDPAGNVIEYTLDKGGNTVAKQIRGIGGNEDIRFKAQQAFDDLGRLSSLTSAYQKETTYTYAENGDTDAYTDPLGRVAEIDLDPLRRLVRTVANRGGPAGETAEASFQYDALDRLVAAVDPKGLTTSYTYNGLNDLTRVASPDTGTTVYGHDAAGNVVSKDDARTDVGAVTYAYDSLGRVIVETPPTEAPAYFDYDVTQPGCEDGEKFALGKLTGMHDASSATQYCYDAHGRVVRKTQSVTGGSTLELGLTYAGAGPLVSMTYPSGAIVTYLRNANGQIRRIVVNGEVLVSSVGYAPFGPRQTITFGNGRVMHKAYDLDYAIDAQNDGVVADGLYADYTLDAVGNITAITESLATTRKFNYDGLGRLISETKPDLSIVEAYTYDATGNRMSKKVETSPGVYSTLAYSYTPGTHRLSNAGVAQVRQYDEVGNTKAIGGALSFVYNERNRLSQVWQSLQIREYVYNPKGERVAKWFNQARANDLQFVYDEAGHLLGEYNSDGARVAEYVWMDNTLVGVIRPHDGTLLQYIETDQLGTPRIVVNPTTNKTIWRWEMLKTAFGDHAPLSDPDGNNVSYTMNLRYPGQYADGLANINYNYYRDYDATVGRYLSSDPIGLGGGWSTYSYVSANPLAGTDPLGLFNTLGYEIAIDYDPENWYWTYEFDFTDTGCEGETATQIGKYAANRHPWIKNISRAMGGPAILDAEPSGDADIRNPVVRCKCINYDPALAKYFQEMGYVEGQRYSEEVARGIVEKLHDKFDELRAAKCQDEECRKESAAMYRWDLIIDKARYHGAVSPKHQAYDAVR